MRLGLLLGFFILLLTQESVATVAARVCFALLNNSTERQIFGTRLELYPKSHPQEGYLHVHPIPELIYVSKGEVSISAGSQSYTLKTGDAAIIPAGASHQLTTASAESHVLKVHKSGQRYLPRTYLGKAPPTPEPTILVDSKVRGETSGNILEWELFAGRNSSEFKVKVLELNAGEMVSGTTPAGTEQMFFIADGQGTFVLRGLKHNLVSGANFNLPENSTYNFLNTNPSSKLIVLIVE